MMKSKYILLNVEWLPDLTRVRATRETYLDCIGRIAGTRELAINGTPYVAAYAITETAVRILRVLHGAQEWPDILPTR